MGDVRGFTFVELMMAMAISALVAGSAFVLLDSGLDLHDSGTTTSVTATGLADAFVWLRADVARASQVAYLAADSLVLDLPNGNTIAWASRPLGGGVAVYRSIDRGSGLVESPLRALAELADGPVHPARLRFEQSAQGIVRAHFRSGDRNVSIEAARWSMP